MAKRTRKGLTVAITGAAGYLGTQVAKMLCEDERVERVLGFDVSPTPKFEHPDYVYDSVDVRNRTLESRFQGTDVVIHLAFIMDPIKDETEMRDVNVNGSQNVFRCAGAADVKKIVYTSSGIVYGAHPNNDVPLDEESPLRANLDFSYPAHKLEVEYVVREFRSECPDVRFVTLRPAIVFGPNVDNAWSHFLETPVLLGIQGYEPPMQFVHEEDVARGVCFSVFEDLDGPYNLAPEGWLEQQEILAAVGKRTVKLPEPIAFSLQERLWDMGLAEAPAGILHYVMHPWVLSTGKLSAAGFKCEYSNLDALSQAVAAAGGNVRMGPLRMTRGQVRTGVAAGVGVAGGLVALRRIRKASRPKAGV